MEYHFQEILLESPGQVLFEADEAVQHCEFLCRNRHHCGLSCREDVKSIAGLHLIGYIRNIGDLYLLIADCTDLERSTEKL